MAKMDRLKANRIVAVFAAVFAAAVPSARGGWNCDPYAWTQEGEEAEAVFVSSGFGFALAPSRKGRTVTVSARVTPLSTDDPEYSSVGGLSIFDDLDHHWDLCILKTPDSKGARHTYELKRQEGGNWTDGLGLRTTVNRNAGPWKFGQPLDLTLRMTPEGVVGVISDPATGKELYRREYAVTNAVASPAAGRPALVAKGRGCHRVCHGVFTAV